MAEFEAIIALSALDGTTGFRLDGAAALDRSGFTVASNGDGFDDLIIGAPGADPTATTPDRREAGRCRDHRARHRRRRTILTFACAIAKRE